MPLGKSQPASAWIHDFVHSTNPKFKGKSRKERIKMALGAYYGKQNEERQIIEARIEEAAKPWALSAEHDAGNTHHIGNFASKQAASAHIKKMANRSVKKHGEDLWHEGGTMVLTHRKTGEQHADFGNGWEKMNEERQIIEARIEEAANKFVNVFHVHPNDSEEDAHHMAANHGALHSEEIGGDSEKHYHNHTFPSLGHARAFAKAAKREGGDVHRNMHPKAAEGRWHPKFIKPLK